MRKFSCTKFAKLMYPSILYYWVIVILLILWTTTIRIAKSFTYPNTFISTIIPSRHLVHPHHLPPPTFQNVQQIHFKINHIKKNAFHHHETIAPSFLYAAASSNHDDEDKLDVSEKESQSQSQSQSKPNIRTKTDLESSLSNLFSIASSSSNTTPKPSSSSSSWNGMEDEMIRLPSISMETLSSNLSLDVTDDDGKNKQWNNNNFDKEHHDDTDITSYNNYSESPYLDGDSYANTSITNSSNVYNRSFNGNDNNYNNQFQQFGANDLVSRDNYFDAPQVPNSYYPTGLIEGEEREMMNLLRAASAYNAAYGQNIDGMIGSADAAAGNIQQDDDNLDEMDDLSKLKRVMNQIQKNSNSFHGVGDKKFPATISSSYSLKQQQQQRQSMVEDPREELHRKVFENEQEYVSQRKYREKRKAQREEEEQRENHILQQEFNKNRTMRLRNTKDENSNSNKIENGFGRNQKGKHGDDSKTTPDSQFQPTQTQYTSKNSSMWDRDGLFREIQRRKIAFIDDEMAELLERAPSRQKEYKGGQHLNSHNHTLTCSKCGCFLNHEEMEHAKEISRGKSISRSPTCRICQVDAMEGLPHVGEAYNNRYNSYYSNSNPNQGQSGWYKQRYRGDQYRNRFGSANLLNNGTKRNYDPKANNNRAYNPNEYRKHSKKTNPDNHSITKNNNTFPRPSTSPQLYSKSSSTTYENSGESKSSSSIEDLMLEVSRLTNTLAELKEKTKAVEKELLTTQQALDLQIKTKQNIEMRKFQERNSKKSQQDNAQLHSNETIDYEDNINNNNINNLRKMKRTINEKYQVDYSRNQNRRSNEGDKIKMHDGKSKSNTKELDIDEEDAVESWTQVLDPDTQEYFYWNEITGEMRWTL